VVAKENKDTQLPSPQTSPREPGLVKQKPKVFKKDLVFLVFLGF